MENTSYALYIAVGVLIGIAILSLLLFRWRRIGFLENSKDDAIAVKNKAEFNAEYEAYNKPLMYGTDVLSCLNKAQNNNQKYVYNNYYGTETETIGKDDRTEFFIDVEVRINSTLCDSIKAFYQDKNGKYQRAIGLGNDTNTKNNYNDKVFLKVNNNYFDDPVIYFYYFKKGIVYQESKAYSEIMWSTNVKNKTLYELLNTGKIETQITGATYHLLEAEDWNSNITSTQSEITQAAKLAALITTVSLKEQQLTNHTTPSNFDKSDWWYCTWTTAAADFKSRKFKCTGVVYNENNGYINKISFEEINN